MKNIRILIIGAGTAGISAAAKLIEKGFSNLTILEAENRIGGRVWSTPFASNVVDLGAQWCHGEKDNAVYQLVKDYKILDESTISYPLVSFLNSSKHPVDNTKCGRLLMLCSEILDEAKENLKDYQGSLGSYVMSKYRDALATPDFSDVDSELAYQVLDYFHKFENSIEASDSWFDTSGSGYLHYEECEGHPLLNWRDKGYKTVLDYIMKNKPDSSKSLNVEGKIQLNKEVSNILWSDPAKSHLIVKCSDGTSYDADHIIVTVSLGVLKENYKNLFTPQLPALKINAIEGLSIGTVDKIFLEFKEPFWEKDWAGVSLLWSREDSEKIRNSSNAWLEDIFGFYKVDYQPNILCGWIGGHSARIMEQLDDQTVIDGCMWLFEKFLGNSMPWTVPVKMLRSKWYSNKHFRGSYSFRSVTTDLLRTSARDLSLPLYDNLGKPVLLFAGEATHDNYYSTVHGALETGYREAERIANFYSNNLVSQSIRTLKNLKEEKYDFVVLGAGIAGLGSGAVLKSANCNFVILEGANHVGGRMSTVNMHSLKNNETLVRVEAGAQWIHGRSNELYKLAENFNFIRPEESSEGEGDYVQENGNKVDDFFVKKIDFKIGQFLEECEEFVKFKNDENFKFPSSVAEYVENNFKSFVDALESNDEKMCAMQLLDWHRRFQIIDNSCLHFEDISAKDWGNYSFNGESCQTHINVNDGMSKIAQKLHSAFKENVVLNKKVELIYWKSEEYPNGVNKISIQCSDGSVYSTNNLICTFSLGVLKQNHLKLFQPPLPKLHRKAIEKIGFGTINKIFINFDKRWWEDDWKGLQVLWNDELNENSHWTRYISGFDVVYPSDNFILLGWIGGKGAIEMEKLSDREIIDECMNLLRKFLKRGDIPEPSHFYTSRWNSNELIEGAYSFTSKDTDDLKHWEKILSQPITFESSNSDRNIILLAGEACHEQYFSTVHGAFLSGIEQAKKILKFRSQKITENLTFFLSKL